ncbi:glycosyltransferase family 2 protein [Gimibacter soli]|uniref:Glycosyltransferase family A protein n=1 Tax=Gimibacter soli TaxID=3024400 RepID=A0AAE9XVY2_9PROT|nr:glycosyltransferase family A protein [Gimibacter soli]WCL54099.1 glycosyltransferase family A protein [Gimibacter soli]
MSNIEISFIIPYFNDHPFLEECLSSIRAHCSVPYEIIVVDDASPDTSALQAMDAPDLCVILKRERSGPAQSRNMGIEKAQGRFLMFIDSDDMLEADPAKILSDARKLGVLETADMLAGFVANRPARLRLLRKAPFTGTLESEPVLMRLHYFTTALYRREMILQKQLRFPESLRSGEDLLFLTQSLAAARQVLVTRHQIYHYRQRPGSLTQQAIKVIDPGKRMEMLEGIATTLAPFPAAKALRCLSALRNNLEDIDKVTETNRAIELCDALADWATEHLGDDNAITACLQSGLADWDAGDQRVLDAMRAGMRGQSLHTLAVARRGAT